MTSLKSRFVSACAAGALSLTLAVPASAQLGKQMGLIEPNVAADSALLTLPHMNAAIVQALKDARPILSITARAQDRRHRRRETVRQALKTWLCSQTGAPIHRNARPAMDSMDSDDS